MLEFCPVCKRLLMQKEENGKIIGVCSCGFIRTAGINIEGEDNNYEKGKLMAAGITNENEGKGEGFSRICEKCGFDKCEMFQITSNESEVTIFKCLKCGHSVRQAQGSSKA